MINVAEVLRLDGKRTETSDTKNGKVALTRVLLTYNHLPGLYKDEKGMRIKRGKKIEVGTTNCWRYFVQSGERTRYQ